MANLFDQLGIDRNRPRGPRQRPQAPSFRELAAQQVTAELSAPERFMVGVGRGAVELGRGLRDFAADIGLARPETPEQRAAAIADRERFEAGVGQTTAGTVGRIVGEAAPLTVPGIGLGARVAQHGARGLAAFGAAEGAVAGALQETAGDERLQNIALGAGLGAAAPLGLEAVARGVGRAANIARGVQRPEAAAVEAAAREADIPLLASDIGQNVLVRKSNVLAESVPFSGAVGFRRRQAEAARAAAQEQAQQFLPTQAAPDDTVGQIIQQSLRAEESRVRTQAREMFEAVAKRTESVPPVVPDNAARVASRFLDEQAGTIAANATAAQALRQVTELGPVTFRQLQASRSNLGDIATRLEIAGDRKAARPLWALRSALTDDMETLARQAGADVMDEFRDALRFFREEVAPFKPRNNRALARALQTENPDTIYQAFIRAATNPAQERTNMRLAEQLFERLDENGKQAVRTGILQDAYEMGLQSGPAPFSPAKYAGHLERLKGARAVFFQGQAGEQIDGLANVMRHIERAGQFLENPPTGARLTTPVLGIAVGGPLHVALGVGGAALMQLFLQSATGRRILTAAAKARPGSPRMARIIDQIEAALPAVAAPAIEGETAAPQAAP